MNVLVVDDQPNMARVTAIALKLVGCRAFTAPNTTEATHIMDTEKIDALFLDVNLGGESGWDFLSLVLAHPVPPPVVMFTALTKDEFAGEAIRRGALDCLVKPFTLDDLRHQVTRIEQVLHQRKNQQK